MEPRRLSDSELKTLVAKCNGLNTKEVAEQLSISPRTVECHLDRIRIKLGAKHNMHAVYIALKENIIQ